MKKINLKPPAKKVVPPPSCAECTKPRVGGPPEKTKAILAPVQPPFHAYNPLHYDAHSYVLEPKVTKTTVMAVSSLPPTHTGPRVAVALGTSWQQQQQSQPQQQPQPQQQTTAWTVSSQPLDISLSPVHTMAPQLLQPPEPIAPHGRRHFAAPDEPVVGGVRMEECRVTRLRESWERKQGSLSTYDAMIERDEVLCVWCMGVWVYGGKREEQEVGRILVCYLD